MKMNLQKILENLPIQAEWVSIREISETISYRHARNENLEQCRTTYDHGFLVEVLHKGQFAYAATNTHTPEAIDEAAQRAFNMALAAEKYTLFPFTTSVRPVAQGHFNTTNKTALTLKDVSDLLVENTQHLKISESIVNAQAHAMVIERETHMVCSRGSDVSHHIKMIQFSLSATAQRDNQTQTRSNGSPFLPPIQVVKFPLEL